jgi:hypothetical protein
VCRARASKKNDRSDITNSQSASEGRGPAPTPSSRTKTDQSHNTVALGSRSPAKITSAPLTHGPGKTKLPFHVSPAIHTEEQSPKLSDPGAKFLARWVVYYYHYYFRPELMHNRGAVKVFYCLPTSSVRLDGYRRLEAAYRLPTKRLVCLLVRCIARKAIGKPVGLLVLKCGRRGILREEEEDGITLGA